MMRAAVIHEWGGPERLRVETVPDPTPAQGEVIVELRASALNWHDAILRQSGRGFPLPNILGMDGAGVRRDTGEEVVIYPCLHWGENSAGPGGDFAIFGDANDGTYAELVAVPEANLYPKPAHLSWEEAAALPCAALTAYRALFTRAGVQPGETVLVLGAGSGVSTFAVMFAAAVDATVFVRRRAQRRSKPCVPLVPRADSSTPTPIGRSRFARPPGEEPTSSSVVRGPRCPMRWPA
jgi:zinc-binding alcohol dehydrogenase/oxidoreductase